MASLSTSPQSNVSKLLTSVERSCADFVILDFFRDTLRNPSLLVVFERGLYQACNARKSNHAIHVSVFNRVSVIEKILIGCQSLLVDSDLDGSGGSGEQKAGSELHCVCVLFKFFIRL